jgi:hypothetical protein
MSIGIIYHYEYRKTIITDKTDSTETASAKLRRLSALGADRDKAFPHEESRRKFRSEDRS